MSDRFGARFIRYVYINCVSLSILLNTILGGLPYQTFSARNWELKKAGLPNFVWLIDFVIWFEGEHCMQCWIRWKIGRYAVMNYDDREASYEPLRHRESNPYGL